LAVLIPKKISDPAKKTTIVKLLNWFPIDGQRVEAKLSYLPRTKSSVAAKEVKAISSIES
jgi:hypothetical protein